jgi:molecular chaperone DnaK
MPQIEVTFDIDASGILTVTATDKGTGKSEKLTIMAPQRLSKDQIDRAMRDAESHADDDRRAKELVETRNQADSLIYATEKLLREMGDKISEPTRKAVQDRVEDVKKALDSKDLPTLRKAIDALNAEAQKIGIEIYQRSQQAAAPPPSGGSGSDGGPDDPGDSGGASGPKVVDADFEEVDK